MHFTKSKYYSIAFLSRFKGNHNFEFCILHFALSYSSSLFKEHIEFVGLLGLVFLCARLHVTGDPYVGANNTAVADVDSSENCRIGIDDDIVADDRVTWNTLYWLAVLVERETLCSECYTLIELDVLADDAGSSDNHTRSVVDGEMASYCCGRVDVDASL